MNALALYAGYDGLGIGISLAEPEYRTVCYVEREAAAAANLVARMAAKELHQAPIWDDSGTFNGYPWRGTVDILTAGFPCPEVSVAGKRKGIHGERWLWDDVARIGREARPKKMFLENVRGLVSANDGLAFTQVLGDLASMGFDVWWGCVSAASVGARHKRERIFIVANAQRPKRKRRGQGSNSQGWKESARQSGLGGGALGNAKNDNRWGDSVGNEEWFDWYGGGLPTSPPSPADEKAWSEIIEKCSPASLPAIYGMDDGTSKRVDRLRKCGNGVHPLSAAYAWRVGQAVLASAAGEGAM